MDATLRTCLAALCLWPLVVFAGDPIATPAWRSGFENGFPGEFFNYDDGAYSPTGAQRADRTSTWTIIGRDEVPSSVSARAVGNKLYKGWVHGVNSVSHRAYPVLHADIPSPLVNSFLVYLDVDYATMGDNWVHLVTWSNNTAWYVFTMSVRWRKLEMAHLEWKYIGPRPQPDFPVGKWVRMTAYLHLTAEGAGDVHVWQDGVPVLKGRYPRPDTNPRYRDRYPANAPPGPNLLRAHWGMYASGELASGTQYKDEIQIWTLSGPWLDVTREPPSPY